MGFVFGILYIVLIAWAVLDVMGSKKTTEQKLIWILVIIFFPIGGSLIYFLLSRNILKM